jgi:uncharacterized membrane protein YbhN (UPF0104 family)
MPLRSYEQQGRQFTLRARGGTETVVAKVWAWGRLAIGAGILVVVLWRLGTAAFLDGLRVIDGWTVAAALGIGVLTTVSSAWRWCLVARGMGVELPVRGAVADYYRSLFLNAALPGGVLGDVHRAVRSGKQTGDVGRGIRAVVLERTAGQIVFFGIGIAVLVISPPAVLAHLHVLTWTHVLYTAAFLAVLGVAAAGWRQWKGGTSKVGGMLRTGVTDARKGLLGRYWPGIAFSSAVLVAGHLATFVVAARAAGSTAPIGTLVPLMMLALFAMTLPINIGGWGPREGVCAWAFAAAGLGAEQGVTIAVVYGLLAFVAALPGAAVLAAQWFVRVRAQRAERRPAASAPAAVPSVVLAEPVRQRVAQQDDIADLAYLGERRTPVGVAG